MSLARDIADLASVTTRLDTVGGSSGALSNRRLTINGAMEVAQRGTSVTGNNGSGYITCDRWLLSGGIGTRTVTQQADAPEGFYNSYKIEITTAETSPSAGHALALEQRMEGQNLQMLKKGTSNALPITISFWVKSNKTGTYIVEIDDNDNARNINKSYTVSSSGAWEYKTITFEGDTTGSLDNDNDNSLRVFFWLDAGSNFRGGTLATSWESTTNANRAEGNVTFADTIGNTWQVTGVQLEVGDTATDFEHRSFGDELARCQRYTYRINGNSSDETMVGTGYYFGTTTFRGMVNFPVTMRAEPTVSTVDANLQLLRDTASDTSITLAGSLDESVYSCGFNLSNSTSTSVGEGGILRLQATTSAYIEFDAEL